MIVERVNFDIVHGCQLKCIGCAWSTKNEKIRYVSLDNFDLICKNINIKRTKKFRLFNFGEPLLHRELPEIVQRIKKIPWRADRIEISTNGQMYNEERLARTLEQKILNRFYVSCDGDGTPESFEKYRFPGKWDKLIHFLREVKKLRDKYCPETYLGTRTICSEESHRKRWLDILGPMGWVPEFRLMGFGPESINSQGKTYTVPKGLCKLVNPKSHGMPRLFIDYDGTMVPCCRHPRAYVLGNLLEHDFKTIFKSNRYRDFLKRLGRDRASVEICNQCDQA